MRPVTRVSVGKFPNAERKLFFFLINQSELKIITIIMFLPSHRLQVGSELNTVMGKYLKGSVIHHVHEGRRKVENCLSWSFLSSLSLERLTELCR